MNLGLVRWDTCWLPTGQPPYPGHLAPTSFLCLILCLLSFCLFLSSGNPTAAAETGGFYQGDFWSSGNDRMERQKDRGRSLKPLPNASGGRGASQMRLLQKLWFWEKNNVCMRVPVTLMWCSMNSLLATPAYPVGWHQSWVFAVVSLPAAPEQPRCNAGHARRGSG